MSKSKPIYENDHYEIKANVDFVGYSIFNKGTNVKEGVSDVLPSAIGKADVWSDLLKEIINSKGSTS